MSGYHHPHHDANNALDIFRVVFFALFLFWVQAASIMYAINIMRKDQNLYVRVRMPLIMLLQIATIWVSISIVCCREIFIGLGSSLPCIVTQVVTVVSYLGSCWVTIVRGLQLVVIFLPEDGNAMRERMVRLVKVTGIIKWLMLLLCTLGFHQLLVPEIKLCRTM